MNEKSILLTANEFAKLHNVNKRTLHYYDEIGLFSPAHKGENNYRYYDYIQSMDFEYIRMLKDLNMSLGEIKAYIDNPNSEKFMNIAEVKIKEIDEQIKRLTEVKEILSKKMEDIKLCNKIEDGHIQIIYCQEEKLMTTPFDFNGDNFKNMLEHIKDTWSSEQYSKGIGSYISADKVIDLELDYYDGLFIPADNNLDATDKETLVKPAGEYLCGYCIGSWDKLIYLYEKMVKYAEKNKYKLVGYAYENGLNDFAVKDKDEYVTRVMIKIEK